MYLPRRSSLAGYQISCDSQIPLDSARPSPEIHDVTKLTISMWLSMNESTQHFFTGKISPTCQILIIARSSVINSGCKIRESGFAAVLLRSTWHQEIMNLIPTGSTHRASLPISTARTDPKSLLQGWSSTEEQVTNLRE